MPKISVLIPTFNYARFLPEAIESVLSQDFQDFELLIVDDCSRDNTAEVVRPYCVRDPRARFEANPTNRGMVANWNYCLSQARGEYIKYLFGDDKLASPSALGKLVSLLENNPGARLAVSARDVIDEHSRPINRWDYLGKGGLLGGKQVITRCLARGMNMIGEPSVVLFRKRDASRGFNPAYRQFVDLEMWFHLIEDGQLAYTPEPLCCFRRHGNQQTVVNESSKVGEREFCAILEQYGGKSWLFSQSAPMEKCGMIYRMNKVASVFPESAIVALSRRYRARLGLALLYLWPCFRLRRISENMVRSTRKRLGMTY